MGATASVAWGQDCVDAVVEAAHSQQWGVVHTALDVGFPVNACCASGRTLAYWAAMSGHVPTLIRLVALGADLGATNVDGCTPIHCAALYGYVEAMRVLVGAGGDINAVNNHGWTPLITAAVLGHVPVVRYGGTC